MNWLESLGWGILSGKIWFFVGLLKFFGGQASMFNAYYQMTKPGIIMGNAITAIAGFALASKGHVDAWLFLPTILGLSLIIASACVFNNYIDRKIDKKMARTKKRAMATGEIGALEALLFATILGALGVLLLALFTNAVTLSVAAGGFVVYVIVYGFWKRRSPLGTIIGSIAGAVPPVVGYTAVAGQVDNAALILFLIVVAWQMPHFYAISIFRLKEYVAADIPVLPVKNGIAATKLNIMLYISLFTVTAPLLTVLGYTSKTYFIVAVALGLRWLWLGIKGFKAQDETAWARQMFFFSLTVITGLSAVLVLDTLLP